MSNPTAAAAAPTFGKFRAYSRPLRQSSQTISAKAHGTKNGATGSGASTAGNSPTSSGTSTGCQKRTASGRSHSAATPTPPSDETVTRFIACDMCRQRKIKCDGRASGCAQCTSFGSSCKYTPRQRNHHAEDGNYRVKKESAVSHPSIKHLEERIVRIEQAVYENLRKKGVAVDPAVVEGNNLDVLSLFASQASTGISEGQHTHLQPAAAPAEPAVPVVPVETQPAARPNASIGYEAPGTDPACAFVQDTFGHSKFVGPASAFSYFSQRGLQWIYERTGEDLFDRLIRRLARSEVRSWVEDIVTQGEECFQKPLDFEAIDQGDYMNFDYGIYGYEGPDIDELSSRLAEQAVLEKMGLGGGLFDNSASVRILIDEYFTLMNPYLPLFNRETFQGHLDKMLEDQGSEFETFCVGINKAFQVCLYMVVALALLSRSLREGQPNSRECAHSVQAWELFKRAWKIVPTIIFSGTNILSVQALISIALFLTESEIDGTSARQNLLAMATTTGYAMGIHTSVHAEESEAHREERRNVLWVSYILDKDMALIFGLPPYLRDENITAALPPADGYFGWRVGLSRIQNRVFDVLYSRRRDGEYCAGENGSIEVLEEKIRGLDTELRTWRRRVLQDTDPDNYLLPGIREFISNTEQGQEISDQWVLKMHFRMQQAYFFCLTSIHRPLSPAFRPNYKSRPYVHGQQIGFQVCIDAARNCTGIIPFLEKSKMKMFKSGLVFLMASLFVLFTNALENPHMQLGADQDNDLVLMGKIVAFVQKRMRQDETALLALFEFLVELEKVAKVKVERVSEDAVRQDFMVLREQLRREYGAI